MSFEKHSSPDREFDLSFGSKKQSKLENMLDKLRKRKVRLFIYSINQSNYHQIIIIIESFYVVVCMYGE